MIIFLLIDSGPYPHTLSSAHTVDAHLGAAFEVGPLLISRSSRCIGEIHIRTRVTLSILHG